MKNKIKVILEVHDSPKILLSLIITYALRLFYLSVCHFPTAHLVKSLVLNWYSLKYLNPRNCWCSKSGPFCWVFTIISLLCTCYCSRCTNVASVFTCLMLEGRHRRDLSGTECSQDVCGRQNNGLSRLALSQPWSLEWSNLPGVLWEVALVPSVSIILQIKKWGFFEIQELVQGLTFSNGWNWDSDLTIWFQVWAQLAEPLNLFCFPSKERRLSKRVLRNPEWL